MPNGKKVFFFIIIFAVVGSAAIISSYKPPENQLVVAISPFSYTSVEVFGSDFNTANELKEKLEENKNLGIKVTMLEKPISDDKDARFQGKKVGAHLVIYGETKVKIGNRGEIKFNILPLVILEERPAVPSFEIKNGENNNLFVFV